MKKILVAIFSVSLLQAFNDPTAPVFNKDLPFVFVPIVKASPETLAGYGTIVYPQDFDTYKVQVVTWPASGWRQVEPGTGNEGGTTQGHFKMIWEDGIHYATNEAVGKTYCTGWFHEQAEKATDGTEIKRPYVITFEANYHPDGGQLVVPFENKPFVAFLALPGDDVTPAAFKAFYFDGTFGVEINPNVWHQPFFSVTDNIMFGDRQGKVHACIPIEFPQEFNCYMLVPLFCP